MSSWLRCTEPLCCNLRLQPLTILQNRLQPWPGWASIFNTECTTTLSKCMQPFRMAKYNLGQGASHTHCHFAPQAVLPGSLVTSQNVCKPTFQSESDWTDAAPCMTDTVCRSGSNA